MPMPGASAIGWRAQKPISKQPNAAATQVAAIAAAKGTPASARIVGLTKTMYDIVTNVVAPPISSARQLVRR